MQIAIVDDITEERKVLIKRLLKQFEQSFVHVEFLEYENGESFLTSAQKSTFNVVFLDIYMDGMNGIQTAEQLRTFDSECLLIFTTTSTDHALDGFRVRAMHYLVKPYTEDDIRLLTKEILQRLPQSEKYINIKVNGSDVRLYFKDIVYAEHYSHQIHINTSNNKVFLTRQTFGKFTELLTEDHRFFICNRGVIINLEHVADFDGTTFVTNDGRRINVSRNMLKSARQTFMDFLFKRGNL